MIGFKILFFRYQITDPVNIIVRINIFLGNEIATIINEESDSSNMNKIIFILYIKK